MKYKQVYIIVVSFLIFFYLPFIFNHIIIVFKYADEFWFVNGTVYFKKAGGTKC